jgi:hypothetical protein
MEGGEDARAPDERNSPSSACAEAERAQLFGCETRSGAGTPPEEVRGGSRCAPGMAVLVLLSAGRADGEVGEEEGGMWWCL